MLSSQEHQIPPRPNDRYLKWGSKTTRSNSTALVDVTASSGYQALPKQQALARPTLPWGSTATADSRPSGARLPVRPVSARTWVASTDQGPEGARLFGNGLYGLPGSQPGTGLASASTSEPAAARISTSIHINQLYNTQGTGPAWLASGEGGAQYESSEAEASALSPRAGRLRTTSAASSVARSSIDSDSGNSFVPSDRRSSTPAALRSSVMESPRSTESPQSGRTHPMSAAEMLSSGFRTSASFKTAGPISQLPQRPASSGGRPLTPSGRMQQQLAFNQQKRRERLQNGAAIFSEVSLRDRMGIPGSSSSLAVPNGELHLAPVAAPNMATPSTPRMAARRAAALAESEGNPSAAAEPSLTIYTPLNTSLPATAVAVAADLKQPEEAPLWESQSPVPREGQVESITQQAVVLARSPSPQPYVMDLTDIRSFVCTPGPRDAPLQCRIIRSPTGTLRSYDSFAVYIDGPNRSFLLAARKRKKSKNPNYLISLDARGMVRQSPAYCGKLRGNFLGTEFTALDTAANPEKGSPADGALILKHRRKHEDIRSELAAVMYGYNVMGSGGPRKMTVALPRPDTNNQKGSRFLQTEQNGPALIGSFKQQLRLRDMIVLHNKAPKWNEQLHAYCLNFGGRVTEASVKNFQLVGEGDADRVVLQFGKVGKDTFTMDYRYPMTALQAFSICLTSFDHKMACE